MTMCLLVFELGNAMKRILIVLLSIVCLGALSGIAADAPKANPYRGVLSKVSPAELPAKAAELVKKAKARDWGNTTVNVVKAALEANPAAAPAVVSAIARAVPQMAPVAAGTAAEGQPKQLVAIARAAAAAAPAKAPKIAVAVSRAVPNSYRLAALTVAETVPGSGRAILEALAAAFPELKPGIERGLARYTGDMPPMASILDQAAAMVASAPDSSGLSRGPSTGPPYIHQTHTPSTITPANSALVPPGGRSYSPP